MDDTPHRFARASLSHGDRWRAAARRMLLLVLLGTTVVSASGCQIVIGILMILRGLPPINADFEDRTGQTLVGKSKRVLVFCTSPESARRDFATLDVDLITELTRKLRAYDINVVDEHKVASWLDRRGIGIDDDSLPDVADEFKADYVIFIKMDEFTLNESGSKELLRGHAKGFVHVFEVKRKGNKSDKTTVVEKTTSDGTAGDGRVVLGDIYAKPFDTSHPPHQPVMADRVGPLVFRGQFIAKLSEELARLFHDYRVEDEI